MIHLSHHIENVERKRVSQPAPSTPRPSMTLASKTKRNAQIFDAVHETRRRFRRRNICCRSSLYRRGQCCGDLFGAVWASTDKIWYASQMPAPATATETSHQQIFFEQRCVAQLQRPQSPDITPFNTGSRNCPKRFFCPTARRPADPAADDRERPARIISGTVIVNGDS